MKLHKAPRFRALRAIWLLFFTVQSRGLVRVWSSIWSHFVQPRRRRPPACEPRVSTRRAAASALALAAASPHLSTWAFSSSASLPRSFSFRFHGSASPCRLCAVAVGRVLRRSVPPPRPWMSARLPSSSSFACTAFLLDLFSILIFRMTRLSVCSVLGRLYADLGYTCSASARPLPRPHRPGLTQPSGMQPPACFSSVLFMSLRLCFPNFSCLCSALLSSFLCSMLCHVQPLSFPQYLF